MGTLIAIYLNVKLFETVIRICKAVDARKGNTPTSIRGTLHRTLKGAIGEDVLEIIQEEVTDVVMTLTSREED